MFNGSSILVTGGTGSFGQKFIDAIISNYKPSRLVVFSRDELKQSEMARKYNQDFIRFFLGDIRDYERVYRALNKIDYVVHAAALKQVPALEYNPTEAVKTNILGSQNIIYASIERGIKKVLALSTDKAANPVNLYGATKFVADKLFIAGNNIRGEAKTEFSVVRYGNVMGSRGSVVPLFRDIIKQGRSKLPITDPEMTRFNLTLNEGVNFVMKCFGRMQGGEIFVPKIPSIRITDLAKAMAPEMEHEYVGMRPGEKMHETLCPSEVSHTVIEFEDFYLIQPESLYVQKRDFSTTPLGEKGKSVGRDFFYRSDLNPQFMSVEDIKKALQDL